MNYKMAMFRDKDREPSDIESALFVDPGLGGTGWAYFENFNTMPSRPTLPAASGVILLSRKRGQEDGWISHVADIASHFRGTLSAYAPRLVVIEQPQLWENDAKSHAATTVGAKGEPGDLFKLTYLVGQIGFLSKDMLGVLPILIHPFEWKGQLPKELVLHRLEKLGVKADDHEADAIGMGIAAQGKL